MVVSSSASSDGRVGPPARAAAPSRYGSIFQADHDENPPSSRSSGSNNRRAALALTATLGVSSLVFVLLRTPSSSDGGANGLKKHAAGGRPATLSNSILGGTWWGLTEDVLGDSADAFSVDASNSDASSSSSDDNDEAASMLEGPICEYVSTRKVNGIQTSKKLPGKQWSEISCREHSEEDSDIVPEDDAAVICW